MPRLNDEEVEKRERTFARLKTSPEIVAVARVISANIIAAQGQEAAKGNPLKVIMTNLAVHEILDGKQDHRPLVLGALAGLATLWDESALTKEYLMKLEQVEAEDSLAVKMREEDEEEEPRTPGFREAAKSAGADVEDFPGVGKVVAVSGPEQMRAFFDFLDRIIEDPEDKDR